MWKSFHTKRGLQKQKMHKRRIVDDDGKIKEGSFDASKEKTVKEDITTNLLGLKVVRQMQCNTLGSRPSGGDLSRG